MIYGIDPYMGGTKYWCGIVKDSTLMTLIITAKTVVFMIVHRIISTAALDGTQMLCSQQCILAIPFCCSDNEYDSND